MKKTIQTDDSEETNNEVNLEDYVKEWTKKINYCLKDEDKEEKRRVELSSDDLTKIEYNDFEATLKKKTSKKEMDEFGEEVKKDIFEQRPKHLYIEGVLNEGKNALESRDVMQASDILSCLKVLQGLADKFVEQEKPFYNKFDKISELRKELNSLIQSQEQQAQIQV